MTMERFNTKWIPVTESGCWLWIGSCDDEGYGYFKLNGKTRKAHRVSYEYHRGPIPQNLVIDHLCRVTGCVNPDHLEIVTVQVNVLRGVGPAAMAAKQTHCTHGHALTEQNTYHYLRERICKICRRKRQLAYLERKGIPS